MKKKVIITTYFFPPDNTPRAFRAFELAKFFSQSGHNVSIFVPDNDQDFSELETQHNFKVIKVRPGILINKLVKASNKKVNQHSSALKSAFKNLKEIGSYFVGNKDIEYAFTLYKSLLQKVEDYDHIISVSLPFSVCLGTALFINSKQPKGTSIAEFGDPYYYSPFFKRFVLHKYLQKWAIKKHNYVTIPTPKFLKDFTPFKEESKVSIIPQGFDFSSTKTAKYEKNISPTFAYAGIFYEGERDPREFLEFLSALPELNFKFYVYTDLLGKVNHGYKLAEAYKQKLGNKLILHDLIPRDECIYELSKMDFLINIETPTASPSKLIDYKLTGRPTLQIDKKGTYKSDFHSFVRNDYSQDYSKNLDINNYDIKNVGQRFLELLEN